MKTTYSTSVRSLARLLARSMWTVVRRLGRRSGPAILAMCGIVGILALQRWHETADKRVFDAVKLTQGFSAVDPEIAKCAEGLIQASGGSGRTYESESKLLAALRQARAQGESSRFNRLVDSLGLGRTGAPVVDVIGRLTLSREELENLGLTATSHAYQRLEALFGTRLPKHVLTAAIADAARHAGKGERAKLSALKSAKEAEQASVELSAVADDMLRLKGVPEDVVNAIPYLQQRSFDTPKEFENELREVHATRDALAFDARLRAHKEAIVAAATTAAPDSGGYLFKEFFSSKGSFSGLSKLGSHAFLLVIVFGGIGVILSLLRLVPQFEKSSEIVLDKARGLEIGGKPGEKSVAGPLAAATAVFGIGAVVVTGSAIDSKADAALDRIDKLQSALVAGPSGASGAVGPAGAPGASGEPGIAPDLALVLMELKEMKARVDGLAGRPPLPGTVALDPELGRSFAALSDQIARATAYEQARLQTFASENFARSLETQQHLEELRKAYEGVQSSLAALPGALDAENQKRVLDLRVAMAQVELVQRQLENVQNATLRYEIEQDNRHLGTRLKQFFLGGHTKKVVDTNRVPDPLELRVVLDHSQRLLPNGCPPPPPPALTISSSPATHAPEAARPAQAGRGRIDDSERSGVKDGNSRKF